jgi:superfamily II DNA/RNA helicase
MENPSLARLSALAETYVASPVVSMTALGATHEANPSVGPQAAHANPAKDAVLLKAADDLVKAMTLAQRDIAIIFNRTKAHAHQGDDLSHLLVMAQQFYELAGELKQSIQHDILRQAHG